MSYEIVKTLRLEQKENGSWYAVVKSASNNVYPHYYTEWTYGKDEKYDFTKEELQAEILLDFYNGNLKGAKSTKYGQFMTYLGNVGRIWGCNNDKSRACKTYHFYDKLKNKARKDYLSTTKNGCWEFGTKEYENYCKIESKLTKRQKREVKRYLLQEFKEFQPNCKQTIVRVWYDNSPTGNYIYQRKGIKNWADFTDFKNATKYTSKHRLEKVKRLLESNGYKAEFIQV